MDAHRGWCHGVGIIPAYAGSTSTLRIADFRSLGSSPRMRGAPPHPSRRTRKSRDHPRVCGEHRVLVLRKRPRRGIIPAYAGSTSTSRPSMSLVTGSSPRMRGALASVPASNPCHWDHPRVCGEHARLPGGPHGVEGIIPAYAGSTQSLCESSTVIVGSSPRMRGAPRPGVKLWTRNWDHPRVCGEHKPKLSCPLLKLGIIPAYAGSTRKLARSEYMRGGSSPRMRGAPSPTPVVLDPTRDHPRVCGEHRSRLRTTRCRARIIPAYAGSTINGLLNGIKSAGSSPRMRGARCLARSRCAC